MNLNLIAPINSLGYGVTGKNLANELADLCALSLFPMGQVDLQKNDDCAYNIEQAIGRAGMPDWTAPCVRIWHQFNMSHFVGTGKRIGFPIFELDTFNEQERYHLGNLDMILVTSEWARKVVCNNLNEWQQQGHVPHDEMPKAWDQGFVKVVPLGVDRGIFNYRRKNMPNRRKTCRFFTCGKTEIRKGHDVLCDVFNDAFNPSDDVELHIMWENPFLSEEQKIEWEQMYRLTKMGMCGKIIFHKRVATANQVADMMDRMDCGIFMSRAEGWNLEALEMMAMNKPIIITDYSAHTEFCNEDNAHLIHIDETEKANDGIWFYGQGNWAKLGSAQLAEAVNHMRTIYWKKGNGFALDNPMGVETAKKFTWRKSAERLLECLS